MPVLSRLVERELVRRFLYLTFVTLPAFPELADQFAFRPTGSTTAALVTMLSHVTDFLRYNAYVTVVSMDFLKAFDTVRHATLADKLAELSIPDNVYNWIISYFQERQHITRFDGAMSTSCSISASVVQGSAIEPAAFIINASDLHPVHAQNHLVKYADDM